VRTDGWNGYTPLREKGYQHLVVGARDLTIAHRIASLLQRWLLGTYQGAVKVHHLGYYLDEFTFCFNRRNSASRGKLFYRLVQQALETAPIPGQEIVTAGRHEMVLDDPGEMHV
jgi:hypothetical protein